jgi:autotransporter-associated beta strand protein
MTIFSKGTTLALNGAVSGSQGLKIGDVAGSGVTNSARVELNASNSYAGKTTLNGGTVYVSNNSSFSTNSIVVAANTIIRGVGAATNNQILNAVEFGTSGANLNIGSSANDNAISFNGLISGSGSVTAGAKAQANATAMLMGTNNTFTGGVSANNGVTLYVGSIGNKADAQSSIGTGPTITLGSTATNLVGGLRWAKASGNETSDKDFAIAGNAAILANGANNASLTLSGVINSTTATNKTITFAGYNTNTLTINGLINEFAGSTNSVVIGVSSSGTVVLGNTNNSFSGAVSIGQNTTNQSTVLQTAQIGSNGVNSTLGRNGTINIGSSDKDRFTALRYVGEGETSDKVINLSGTTGGAILEQAGTSGNLKFTQAITATGVGAKSITLKGATAATGELGGNIGDGAGSVISLVKNGSGTWILSGSNSYTGTTTVESKDGGGTLLKVMGANALSTKTSFVGSSSLSNIGTVNFGAAGDYTAKSFGNEDTSGNNMVFTNSSGGDVNLTFTNANNVLTLSAAGAGGRNLLNQSANLNIVFNGNMDIGSTNFVTGIGIDHTIGGSGNWLFKGNLTNGAGIRGLQKTGTGALELRGTSNNFTGTTKVDEGTLNLSGSLTASTSLTVSTIGTATNATRGKATLNVASGASLLSGSTTTVYSGGNLIVDGTAGAVVVEANGLLGGSGTNNGVVTLKSGAFLNPGNSPGLLTASSASWAAGSTYNWEIDQASGGTAGVNWDVFSVVNALDLSALSSSAKMNLVLNSLVSMDDFNPNSAYSWVFAQAGSFTGTGLTDGTNVTDLFNITAGTFAGDVLPTTGFKVEVGTDSASSLRTLSLVTIPEPSTGSMLGFGLGGLVLTRLMRRKQS